MLYHHQLWEHQHHVSSASWSQNTHNCRHTHTWPEMLAGRARSVDVAHLGLGAMTYVCLLSIFVLPVRQTSGFSPAGGAGGRAEGRWYGGWADTEPAGEHVDYPLSACCPQNGFLTWLSNAALTHPETSWGREAAGQRCTGVRPVVSSRTSNIYLYSTCIWCRFCNSLKDLKF